MDTQPTLCLILALLVHYVHGGGLGAGLGQRRNCEMVCVPTVEGNLPLIVDGHVIQLPKQVFEPIVKGLTLLNNNPSASTPELETVLGPVKNNPLYQPFLEYLIKLAQEQKPCPPGTDGFCKGTTRGTVPDQPTESTPGSFTGRQSLFPALPTLRPGDSQPQGTGQQPNIPGFPTVPRLTSGHDQGQKGQQQPTDNPLGKNTKRPGATIPEGNEDNLADGKSTAAAPDQKPTTYATMPTTMPQSSNVTEDVLNVNNRTYYPGPGETPLWKAILNGSITIRELVNASLMQNYLITVTADAIIIQLTKNTLVYPRPNQSTGIKPVDVTILGKPYKLPDDTLKIQKLLLDGKITPEVLIETLRQQGVDVRRFGNNGIVIIVGGVEVYLTITTKREPPTSVITITINNSTYTLPDDVDKLHQVIKYGNVDVEILIQQLSKLNVDAYDTGYSIVIVTPNKIYYINYLPYPDQPFPMNTIKIADVPYTMPLEDLNMLYNAFGRDVTQEKPENAMKTAGYTVETKGPVTVLTKIPQKFTFVTNRKQRFWSTVTIRINDKMWSLPQQLPELQRDLSEGTVPLELLTKVFSQGGFVVQSNPGALSTLSISSDNMHVFMIFNNTRKPQKEPEVVIEVNGHKYRFPDDVSVIVEQIRQGKITIEQLIQILVEQGFTVDAKQTRITIKKDNIQFVIHLPQTTTHYTVVVSVNNQKYTVPKDGDKLANAIRTGVVSRDLVIQAFRRGGFTVTEVAPDTFKLKLKFIEMILTMPKTPKDVVTINGVQYDIDVQLSEIQKVLIEGKVTIEALTKELQRIGYTVVKKGNTYTFTKGYKTFQITLHTQSVVPGKLLFVLKGKTYTLPDDLGTLSQLVLKNVVTLEQLEVEFKNQGFVTEINKDHLVMKKSGYTMEIMRPQRIY